MSKHKLFAVVLLVGTAFAGSAPVLAQDIATRIFQMEERIRQLTGQVEELNFTVQQLQRQAGQKGDGSSGELLAPQQQKPALKTLGDPEITDQAGIEVIEGLPSAQKKKKSAEIIGSNADGVFVEQPVQKNFTEGGNAAVQGNDGGFDGQVLVPPGADAQPQQTDVAVGEGVPQADGIETVSLQPADSPDVVYKTANEALLRRQFPDAEAGFRNFLAKYPEHSLAGSAQYWLGETFYVQGDVRQAAQNFLQAYKTYPKSRRAPDSLLKLGMSLNKMGQKDQACAALNSVSTEFPRAVEAKKRATAEYKRAGC